MRKSEAHHVLIAVDMLEYDGGGFDPFWGHSLTKISGIPFIDIPGAHRGKDKVPSMCQFALAKWAERNE